MYIPCNESHSLGKCWSGFCIIYCILSLSFLAQFELIRLLC